MKRKRAQHFDNDVQRNNNKPQTPEVWDGENKQELLDNLDFIVALGNQIHHHQGMEETWLAEHTRSDVGRGGIITANSMGLDWEKQQEYPGSRDCKNVESIRRKKCYKLAIATKLHHIEEMWPTRDGALFRKGATPILSHAEDPLLYSNIMPVVKNKVAPHQKTKKSKRTKEVRKTQQSKQQQLHSFAESPLFTWPIENIIKLEAEMPCIKSSNYRWNMLYGDDDVEDPSEEKDDDDGDIEVTISKDEMIFDDILLKSWERAMDIVSSTIAANCSKKSDIQTASNSKQKVCVKQ